MKDRYDEFAQKGVAIVAVSFTMPKLVANYIEKYPLPFPAVADPERKAYQAFGLDRTNWKDLLRPAVLLRYIKLMFRGWMPWKKQKGADLLQLGGDMILNEKRQVVYSYRSTDPTDRPTMEQLLKGVQKALGK